jgi:iron complex transport system ATP-binding protein
MGVFEAKAMAELLQADDLRFAYAEQEAVAGVSLRLREGEVVALLGPNGSGKSTLIKLLLGHLHGAGSIDWLGRSLRAWRPRELARRVAYLPQSPAWEIGQTVADVLRLGRAPYWRAFGIERDDDLAAVREAAAALHLGELLDRPIDSLSGGQRQRIFLGRCLAQQPRAMLLDEPSSFLDLKYQIELLTTLQRLARERGIGVLMASHDLTLAGLHADRLILLHEGTIAAEGSPEQVFQEQLLSRVYDTPLHCLVDEQGRRVVLPGAREANSHDDLRATRP